MNINNKLDDIFSKVDLGLSEELKSYEEYITISEAQREMFGGRDAQGRPDPKDVPELSPEPEAPKLKMPNKRVSQGKKDIDTAKDKVKRHEQAVHDHYVQIKPEPDRLEEWFKTKLAPMASKATKATAKTIWGLVKNALADLSDPQYGLSRKTISKWGSQIADRLRQTKTEPATQAAPTAQSAQATQASKSEPSRTSGGYDGFEPKMNKIFASSIAKIIGKSLNFKSLDFKPVGSLKESCLIDYNVICEYIKLSNIGNSILSEANEFDDWRYVATLKDDSRELMLMIGDRFIKAKWVKPEVEKEEIVRWNTGKVAGKSEKEASTKYRQLIMSELKDLAGKLTKTQESTKTNEGLNDFKKKIEQILKRDSARINIDKYIKKYENVILASKDAIDFLLIRKHAVKKDGKINHSDVSQPLSEVWDVEISNTDPAHIYLYPVGGLDFAKVRIYLKDGNIIVKSFFNGKETDAKELDTAEFSSSLPRILGSLDIAYLQKIVRKDTNAAKRKAKKDAEVPPTKVAEKGIQRGKKKIKPKKQAKVQNPEASDEGDAEADAAAMKAELRDSLEKTFENMISESLGLNEATEPEEIDGPEEPSDDPDEFSDEEEELSDEPEEPSAEQPEESDDLMFEIWYPGKGYSKVTLDKLLTPGSVTEKVVRDALAKKALELKDFISSGDQFYEYLVANSGPMTGSVSFAKDDQGTTGIKDVSSNKLNRLKHIIKHWESAWFGTGEPDPVARRNFSDKNLISWYAGEEDEPPEESEPFEGPTPKQKPHVAAELMPTDWIDAGKDLNLGASIEGEKQPDEPAEPTSIEQPTVPKKSPAELAKERLAELMKKKST